MYQKFNTSKYYLSNKIFIPEPPQQGQVWTNLNITVLPDYLVYLKSQLSKQQQILISDYHLQTYLLETALKPHPANNFDVCTNQILMHVRSHPQFWVKKGQQQESLKMHQAIEQYNKDCQYLNKQFQGDSKYANKQKQYKINETQKIQQNYCYDGNMYTRGMYRFSATAYPWIAKYISSTAISNLQKDGFRVQIEKIIMQFIIMLTIKCKPQQRQYYFNSAHYNSNYSPELKNIVELSCKNQIQTQFKCFIEFLSVRNISLDTKLYSNVKDYHIICNSLYILKNFVIRVCAQLQSQSQQQKSMINQRLRCENQLFKQQNSHQITVKQGNTKKKQNIDEILQDLVNRHINKNQLQTLLKWLITSQYKSILQKALIRQRSQVLSKNIWQGLLSTESQLQQAFKRYNQTMNHPQNTNRMKYKLDGLEVCWSEDQYQKFLQNFLQFFNVPTNNKKIAIAMGKDIEPNHVKHVKGLYMRNMNLRIDNGQIGGGKKGVFQSKLQFLKKDISSFSMKWFRKQNKAKTKKIKRKRKRQTFDEQQHDSDY